MENLLANIHVKLILARYLLKLHYLFLSYRHELLFAQWASVLMVRPSLNAVWTVNVATVNDSLNVCEDVKANVALGFLLFLCDLSRNLLALFLHDLLLL